MPSSPTTRLRVEKQATGENNNTWGTRINENALDMLDTAVAGRSTFTLSGSKTLTSTNYVADESRAMFLDITSGTGGTVTIPAVEKTYDVRNNTSGSVIITTGSGTTATLTSGTIGRVMSDGTNVYASKTLDYGSSLLSTTGVPTDAAHLTNKLYVDTEVAGAALGASLGAGVLDWLTTPSSANLAIAVTGETGTAGGLVFSVSPAFTGSPTAPTQTAGDNSTKLATTAYVDTSLSSGGWSQIGSTLATTSGTTWTFSSIAATYQDLLVVIEGMSNASANDTLEIQFSGNNGTTWTTAANLGTVNTANGGYGAVHVIRYLGAAGVAPFSLINSTANYDASVSSSGSIAWRIAAGINAIRLKWTNGYTGDAGAVKLFGRG